MIILTGQAPDTFFWADTSSVPSANGFILQDANPTSNCGKEPLAAADGTMTYRVEFPAGKTERDILGGSISIWCKQFSANFGHIVVPTTVIVETTETSKLMCNSVTTTPELYNCEPLNEDFQVRWLVNDNNITVELIGRIEETHYMGFGPSGSSDKTNMDGADPVIADYFQGNYRARDYYMRSRGQCSNGEGVCPDTEMDDLTDDVTNISGERDAVSGITVVRYTKSLIPKNVNITVGNYFGDKTISVTPGDKTYIVWAIGPISPDTGYPNFHSVAFAEEDVSIDFGRTVVDNCPSLLSSTAPEPTSIEPFERPILKDITEFNAVIGPVGGDKGYAAITGRTSWYVF